MEFAADLITFMYYALVAYISAILIWNLIRAGKWEKEILYIVVLLPFLLRLLRLK
jgi:hypothetical protein